MLNLSLWLEVRRWRRAGRTARLWWRDDDAAGGSAELDRLLQAASKAGVPLTLAVVPAGDMAGLRVSLLARPAGGARISVAQHGVDHQNRRTGPAAGEFPHAWTQLDLEIALFRGRSLMRGLPGATAVFVPPWNDAHPLLEQALSACGYAGWSANGELETVSGLPRVDAHLDLLRWRGGARFRGDGRFLRALTAELRRRREAGRWTAPIGLLTHHLVHDAKAWDFLDRLLRWTNRRPELAWTSLPELIADAAGGRVAPALSLVS